MIHQNHKMDKIEELLYDNKTNMTDQEYIDCMLVLQLMYEGKGPPGDPGPPGDQGPPGDPGPAGEIFMSKRQMVIVVTCLLLIIDSMILLQWSWNYSTCP